MQNWPHLWLVPGAGTLPAWWHRAPASYPRWDLEGKTPHLTRLNVFISLPKSGNSCVFIRNQPF